VGAAWPGNKALLLRKFRGLDAGLTPADVSGTARLVGLKQPGGVPHLELALTMSARGVGGPEEGFRPVRFSIEATEGITVPAGYATGPVHVTEDVTMEQSLEGRPASRYAGLALDGRSWDSAVLDTTYLE
jgi:hypothetical protein